MDNVPSVRYQTMKTAARITAQSTVVPEYGMPTSRCKVSDTPVPKMAIA
jgi:hypothetical protein